MKHFKYLSYVCRHKWYVFLACIHLECIWRGIVHDLSKFSPSEWFSYADFFFGEDSLRRAKEGRRRSPEVQDAFDVAWLHHQRRNLHHPQYWVLNKGEGTQEALEMPDIYVREMVADWIGAGRAITGNIEVVAWYKNNRDTMNLHPKTRVRVEELLSSWWLFVPQCGGGKV